MSTRFDTEQKLRDIASAAKTEGTKQVELLVIVAGLLLDIRDQLEHPLIVQKEIPNAKV